MGKLPLIHINLIFIVPNIEYVFLTSAFYVPVIILSYRIVLYCMMHVLIQSFHPVPFHVTVLQNMCCASNSCQLITSCNDKQNIRNINKIHYMLFSICISILKLSSAHKFSEAMISQANI